MLRWLLLLTAALTPSMIAFEPRYAKSTSLTKGNDTRTFALTCHLEPDICNCSMVRLGPPPPIIPGVCLWDATTCQCGRDYQDTGTFEHVVGLPVPAGKNCVIDTEKCECLVGSPPLIPLKSFKELFDSAKSAVQALKTKLEIFNQGGSPADPPTITLEEVIAVIQLLKEVAAKASAGVRLKSVESKEFVEFLGEESAYLSKLIVDPKFMAAQRGKVDAGTIQPIAVRLRAMLTGLEKASFNIE